MGNSAMLKEFKEFALKGNVLDLAVGVIIAGAFGAIIKSLVEDILMPAIGMIFGAPDFSAIQVGALGIGKFLNAAVSFVFVAVALFILVKAVNKILPKPIVVEEKPVEAVEKKPAKPAARKAAKK
jgi:large conductance mechanosensitive channel